MLIMDRSFPDGHLWASVDDLAEAVEKYEEDVSDKEEFPTKLEPS